MGFAIYQTLMILLDVASWTIIIHMILSWLVAFNVINTSNEFVRSIWVALDRITQPVYRPVRRIMPDLGALDLSPMVVLIGITIMQRAILPGIFSQLLL